LNTSQPSWGIVRLVYLPQKTSRLLIWAVLKPTPPAKSSRPLPSFIIPNIYPGFPKSCPSPYWSLLPASKGFTVILSRCFPHRQPRASLTRATI
jgi:hypothetical protein